MFNYTPEQQKAIDILDKNLQIIACAGSGKTQVISQRIVNILKNKDVSPGNIVAFTYTEKAAAELKSRVLKLCKEQIGQINGLAEMYIGTIHAWCLNTLQDNIYEFQKYSVLDEVKLKLFVDMHFNNIGMTSLNMERYKDTNHFISLMTMIRESEINDGVEFPEAVIEAQSHYEECLHNHGYFDFSMIMTEVLKHLNDSDFLSNKLKERIRYLIVDEYQDVNPIQEALIYELYKLGANLCVVGDDDQTIYQWRGSDVENILEFTKKYDNVEYIKLEDNFRSSNGIIDLSGKVISNNSRRLEKIMNNAGHQTYERGDILLEDFESVEDENEFIAKTIQHLRGVEFRDKDSSEPRGLDYSDFCILLRKWKKADKIIDALKEANIPFIVTGVNNLFQQPEAKAAKNIFEYLNNQVDKETLKELWLSLSDKLIDQNIEAAIEYLDTKIPTAKTYYESFVLQDIFMSFMKIAGIKEEVFTDCERATIGNRSEEIIFYNLGMFSKVINDYETIHFKERPTYKLKNFLNFMQYSAERFYPEGWLNNSYRTPNAVQIMTIYQAKGLEFPVVFLPGLNRNYLPSSKMGGKSVWHFLDKNLINKSYRYEGSTEDERRLLYVAATRSMKFLFVSRSPDGSRERVESLFCPELRRSSYIFSSPLRDFAERNRLEPKPKNETNTIELNFSVLKNFFDCAFSFKMYCMYGFSPVLSARIGYGKSIHNVLMEIHKRFLDGDDIAPDILPSMVDRHLHFPYAIPAILTDMTEKAKINVSKYYDENKDSFKEIEFAEKEIQIDLGDGILVNGRMDLIKKKQLDGSFQTYIIDFKSKEDAQTESVSMEQLSIYAMGYQELTGEKADFLQIYNLDKNDSQTKELLTKDMDETKSLIINAANKIRENELDDKCGKKDCICNFK